MAKQSQGHAAAPAVHGQQLWTPAAKLATRACSMAARQLPPHMRMHRQTGGACDAVARARCIGLAPTSFVYRSARGGLCLHGASPSFRRPPAGGGRGCCHGGPAGASRRALLASASHDRGLCYLVSNAMLTSLTQHAKRNTQYSTLNTPRSTRHSSSKC